MSKTKFLLGLFLWGSLNLFFWKFFSPIIWPPEEVGVRAAVDEGNRMVDAHTDGMKETMIEQQDFRRPDGSVDLEKWKASRLPLGSQINDASNARSALIDRAQGRFPIVAQAIVRGNQWGWATMAPIPEAVRVTVLPTDTISPTYQSTIISTADGLYPDGVWPAYYRGDLTVVMEDRQKRGMQMIEPGNMFELIGRKCNEGSCSPAIPMGTDSLVCPGGYLQAWYNGRSVIGQEPSLLAFSTGVGEYRLTITPDPVAKAWCEIHPEAIITKSAKGPAALMQQPGTN